MEYLDLALDYLRDHKVVAAIIAIVFVILLIRNFWFLIKLLVILALGAIALILVSSFLGEATKKKKELMEEHSDSSRLKSYRSYVVEWRRPHTFLDHPASGKDNSSTHTV